MGTRLTDEQRSKIFFTSPEYDQGCYPAMQQIKHMCLECRKKLQENGNPSCNVFDALSIYFQKAYSKHSPITQALHFENYTQAIALINEGANDFNCVVHPEPTLSISTPSLHIATLFGITFKNFASNAQLLDHGMQQMCQSHLDDLLYMYRKLKTEKGINLMLLAAYHGLHPKENIPAVFDVMDRCLATPESERWKHLDQYMHYMAPPVLEKKYDKGGREIWVIPEGGR